MADSILLTGGTGFLGTELASRLVHIPDIQIYVLVRAADQAERLYRLRCAWQHDPDLYREIGGKFRPVPGAFSLPGLGLGADTLRELLEQVTLVLPASALKRS